MATITPTKTRYRSPHKLDVVWEGFAANADVGTAVEYPELFDRTFQILGTFTGSLEITLEGSLDGGTTWFTLTDAADTAIVKTAAAGGAITQVTPQIRPRCTVGTGGGDVDVHLFLRGKK